MNAKYQRLRAEFGPEVRFEVKPEPPGPFRVAQESRFEALKAQLLAERLGQVWKPEWHGSVRGAANEAAALAWVTPYPLLVFPVLFEEKSDAALARFVRQAQIRQHSQELLLV